MVGKTYKLNGQDILILDELNNGLFVLAYNTKIKCKFDNSSNNYFNSSLRNKMDNWAKEHNIKLTNTRVVDLFSLSGEGSYGLKNLVIAPLTFDEYRKYSQIIIPYIKSWFWLCTPNGIGSGDICGIRGNGSVDYGSYCRKGAFVPAFIINKEQLNNPLFNYSDDEIKKEFSRRFY